LPSTKTPERTASFLKAVLRLPLLRLPPLRLPPLRLPPLRLPPLRLPRRARNRLPPPQIRLLRSGSSLPPLAHPLLVTRIRETLTLPKASLKIPVQRRRDLVSSLTARLLARPKKCFLS
jgi:hypothetical protein